MGREGAVLDEQRKADTSYAASTMVRRENPSCSQNKRLAYRSRLGVYNPSKRCNNHPSTPGGVESVGRNIRLVGCPVSQPVPHPDGAIAAAGAYNGNSDSPIGGGLPVRSGGICPGRSRGVLERLVLRGRKRNRSWVSTHLLEREALVWGSLLTATAFAHLYSLK